MKKILITTLAASAFTSLALTSCQPDEPVYDKKFERVINQSMDCTERGDNCAFFNGHHIYKPDQEVQTEITAEYRQLLTTFYKDAREQNVRRFFEQENWQTIFPPRLLNPTVMEKINWANYATIVTGCDSSILFVYRQDGGTEPENLIFAFKRTDPTGAPCNTR